jgi:hypothetical protein
MEKPTEDLFNDMKAGLNSLQIWDHTIKIAIIIYSFNYINL